MLRGDLRIGGGVALAVRLGADEDGRRTVLLDAHHGVLGRAEGADLDVARKPDAADHAALPRRAQPLLEARPAGDLHGAIEMALELARIVDAPHRRLVGHLLRLDEVAGPDLIGRDAHLARREIDEALDEVGGLRPPGAAIGIHGKRVRIEAAEAEVGARDVVEAGRHQPRERGNERREGRQIGAHVGEDVDLEAEDAAFRVERELGLGDVVAPLRIAEEMLAAVADPGDRTAELASRPRPRADIRDSRRPWCRSRRRHRPS